MQTRTDKQSLAHPPSETTPYRLPPQIEPNVGRFATATPASRPQPPLLGLPVSANTEGRQINEAVNLLTNGQRGFYTRRLPSAWVNGLRYEVGQVGLMAGGSDKRVVPTSLNRQGSTIPCSYHPSSQIPGHSIYHGPRRR